MAHSAPNLNLITYLYFNHYYYLNKPINFPRSKYVLIILLKVPTYTYIVTVVMTNLISTTLS